MMGRLGDGRWGDGEVGWWGGGVVGRGWGDGEVGWMGRWVMGETG